MRYLLRQSNPVLVGLAVALLVVVIAGAYWPLRSFMVDQESRVTVIASTHTVTFVLCLAVIGWGGGRLLRRRFGRTRLLYWLSFALFLVVLFTFVDLLGYEVWWLPW